MAISAASLVAAVLVTTAALAQNSPEDYVSLHNAARSTAGAGLVAWDDELAREAGRRAGSCGFRRSSDGGGRRYGENLFRGPPEKAWAAADALGAWTAPAAREYVQVVWPGSSKIGCAANAVFISCNYEPAVNENWRRAVLPDICRYNISRCFNCTIC